MKAFLAFNLEFLRFQNLKFIDQACPKIEEAVLFKYNFTHADPLTLTDKEIEHYIWIHVYYLLELYNYIDSVSNDKNFKNLVDQKDAGSFDDSLGPEFDRLKSRLDEADSQIKADYAEVAPILIQRKLFGVLEEMQRQKRIHLVIKDERLTRVEIESASRIFSIRL